MPDRLNLYFPAIKYAVEAGKAIMEIFLRNDFTVNRKADESPVTIADITAHNIICTGLQSTGIPVLSEEGQHLPFSERRSWNRFWLVDPLDGTKEFVRRSTDFTVNIALIADNAPEFGVIYIPAQNELFFGGKIFGSYKYTGIDFVSENSFEQTLAHSEKLKGNCSEDHLIITGSRSHVNSELIDYYDEMKCKFPGTEIQSRGSSLKFCLLAQGKAHLAPRIGPTYEWDTAAGHAIVQGVGGKVFIWKSESELMYNKENLLNPNFIALIPSVFEQFI